MASKYKYKYKSSINPEQTYSYMRRKLYEIDINELKTIGQLKNYIKTSAELIEEEARRGIEKLKMGRDTSGSSSKVKIEEPSFITDVQQRASLILNNPILEYGGVEKLDQINYLRQEAGKVRQLLSQKSGTYESIVKMYDSFIKYIKKYTGEDRTTKTGIDISYKEAEKLARILELAYKTPTSKYNKMYYATQTQEIVETITQIGSRGKRKKRLLKILNENEDEIYEALGISNELLDLVEVDDSDVIPIFKGNS